MENLDDLRKELARRTDQVTALNQELASFSYSVSHDLRAPLRHVGGFAGLMLRNAATLDDKNQRYLQSVVEAAQQMEQLLEALLTFSRLGQREMRRIPIDLNQLVRDVREEVAAQHEGRDISWEIAPLPEVEGDPDMVRVVLENLIGNAVKYTAPRAQAHIAVGARLDEAGEMVCFVRDNGVGFDMRYSDKLFGVFQRLHRAEDFPGTGIGLANARRIIYRHDGRIWAEGAVDAGATFYFTLPESLDRKPESFNREEERP